VTIIACFLKKIKAYLEMLAWTHVSPNNFSAKFDRRAKSSRNIKFLQDL